MKTPKLTTDKCYLSEIYCGAFVCALIQVNSHSAKSQHTISHSSTALWLSKKTKQLETHQWATPLHIWLRISL